MSQIVSPGFTESPDDLYHFTTRPGDFSSVISGILIVTVVGAEKRVGVQEVTNVRFLRKVVVHWLLLLLLMLLLSKKEGIAFLVVCKAVLFRMMMEVLDAVILANMMYRVMMGWGGSGCLRVDSGSGEEKS